MKTPGRWVLFLAAMLFLWNLWGYALWAPDEPYFAEGAREMLVDGHWVVPHVNGVVTTDKPPLFFWLIALLSLPLGQVTSLTARLPSALAAVATVALTLRLGRRFGEARTAAVAGVVLATTSMFWEKARWSQTDAVLCLLIWVALSAFQAFRRGEARGLYAGLLFWSAVGLAVLDKGPVGLLLPVGIAVLTSWWDGALRRWREFAPWLGPTLFVAIVGAWGAAATFGSGDYSLWSALREHFLDRGLHGMHHAQPPWYYVDRLPAALLPWTVLVPGALLLAWRRRDGADRLLLVVAAFVVVFFSLSTEKRELYVLPAFPAFALLIGRLVGHLCGWEPRQEGSGPLLGVRWVSLSQGLFGGLMVLAALAVPAAAGRAPVELGSVPWILAGLLCVTGGATLLVAWRGEVLRTVLVPAVGFSLVYLVAAGWGLPAFDSVKSARPFALRVESATALYRAEGGRLLAYDLSNLTEPIAFYTGGLYTVATLDQELVTAHFSGEGRACAVADAAALDRLPGRLKDRLEVLDSARLSRRDIVLVCTRGGASTAPEGVAARGPGVPPSGP